MSRPLSTLIDDIYKTLDTDEPVATEEQVKELSDSIASMLTSRLAKPRGPSQLRMSELGTKCLRQLWYKHNKPECGEKLPPQTRLNFLAGDIWEELVLWFAKLSGHEVTGRQDTLEVNGVKGHRDAVIDGHLVDVKTANSRSVEKFAKHQLQYDDPFGYLTQGNFYLEGSKHDEKVTDKESFSFLVLDKERGKLVLDTYPKEAKDYEGIVSDVRASIAQLVPPERKYRGVPDGSSGNEVLGVSCRYCPFKEECWKDANRGRGLRKFLYSTGIKYFTKVVKEPKVDEVL